MRLRGRSLLALAALAMACREAPFQARFAVRGRWNGPREISYRIESAGGSLEQSGLERAIRSALAEWATTGCATFREAGAEEIPALLFSWARDEHGACVPFGADPSMAHAGPVGPGTFVHFDAERSWDGPALRQAALHEIGHALGLDHGPDEEAVMHPEPSPERAHLARSDRAGIHSLYGGGDPARGDLVVTGAREELVLRSIAPPELTDWTLFDTDGDGDAEVLTWRTDAAGQGAMWCYHFAPGPRLARTLGPLYGVIAPALEPAFCTLASGERLLISRPAQARAQARSFDRHGLPQPFEGELPAGAGGEPPSGQADLDGDGLAETVTRHD